MSVFVLFNEFMIHITTSIYAKRDWRQEIAKDMHGAFKRCNLLYAFNDARGVTFKAWDSQ